MLGCWISQRKFMKAIALALAAPAGFVICWTALGQSPSHLGMWIRHGLELESGYSGAMSLVPKTPVLCAALAALALAAGALFATIMRARGGLLLLGGRDHPGTIYIPGVEGRIHAFRGLARLCVPVVSAVGHGAVSTQRPARCTPNISPAGIECRFRYQHGTLPGWGAFPDSGVRMAASCRMATTRCP